MSKRTTRRTKAVSAHEQRIRRLKKIVSDKGADAALVTRERDVAYLTGFLGGDSVLLVPTRGKLVFVSDRRYEEDLQAFAHLATIQMRSGAMHPHLGGLIKDRGYETVLVQSEDLSLAAFESLAKAATKRRLAPEAGLLTEMRIIKDASEISGIRAAIRLQEAAMLSTLENIGPGMTELEICAWLEWEMKTRGASGPAFGTIVGAKASGSLPHYMPGDVRTAKNTSLLIDWGAELNGYRGDMTRVFAFGRWPKEIKEIYSIVSDAHEKAAAAIRPGVTNRELDSIAREHITQHGYGDEFSHSLGHGIGLETHEAPGLGQLAPEIEMRPGMVITIEPGVYLPGVGGVRIEDDYAVTERGRRNLSSLPKDLDFATL
ncbi:MAG: Xaa-Pro peptidase family protein [Planctomycetota bacterium]